MIDHPDFDRLREPSQRRWLANSLGLYGCAASLRWAVDQAVDRLSAVLVAERYPTYSTLRREARGMARQALEIRDRFHEYAARSTGVAEERYLHRAVGWRAPRDDVRDALQEARVRLLEQVRARPFACDTRYTCYEQFRKAVRTTAYRILDDTRRRAPHPPAEVTDPAVAGLRRSVWERLAGQLGGPQRFRWVVAACEGLTVEEIAEAETTRLREPVEAFVVYHAIDVMCRLHKLGNEVPLPPRPARERYVRDWLRYHGYDQQVPAADVATIVGALVDDVPSRDQATREHVARLSWDLTWFRYWINPGRAELDRRLEECRRTVRRHCPELDKAAYIDTVAAHMAGEPQAETARRQHHARLRRSAQPGAVKSELCMLRNRYPSVGVITPA